MTWLYVLSPAPYPWVSGLLAAMLGTLAGVLATRAWLQERAHPDFTLAGLCLVFAVLCALLPRLAPSSPRLAVLVMGVCLALAHVCVLRLFHRSRQLAQQQRRTAQMLQESQTQCTERLAEAERQQQSQGDQRLELLIQRERKRIAGDLHDDLGAKLLTIVHTSTDARISSLAREALEEMRLSVRGLSGKPVALADALGDWRAEIVSRLQQAGLDIEWMAPEDDAPPHSLPASTYVNLTRILREAISNVLKHSSASRCVVRCTVLQGDLQLLIQDNGRGIPSDREGRVDRGHGLASMKARAKRLQGQCLVESAAGWGTLIRLSIPL